MSDEMLLSDIEEIGRSMSVRSYLATTDGEGHPHVVPVHPGWEGSTIWVMTTETAKKARNIASNPNIAMHWESGDAGDGLLVWGRASIHDDAETKHRLWHGVFDYDLSAFAPNGPDSPEIVFLAVTPTKAAYAKAYGAGGVQRWQAG